MSILVSQSNSFALARTFQPQKASPAASGEVSSGILAYAQRRPLIRWRELSGPWALGEAQNAGWVEMITRKLCQVGEDGLIAYGYKFRPKLQEA